MMEAVVCSCVINIHKQSFWVRITYFCGHAEFVIFFVSGLPLDLCDVQTQLPRLPSDFVLGGAFHFLHGETWTAHGSTQPDSFHSSLWYFWISFSLKHVKIIKSFRCLLLKKMILNQKRSVEHFLISIPNEQLFTLLLETGACDKDLFGLKINRTF